MGGRKGRRKVGLALGEEGVRGGVVRAGAAQGGFGPDPCSKEATPH